MLRITKATDVITIEQLIATIYSNPGLGKTSLGFSAESPLLLDFDGGVYRACNRRDAVQVHNWSDVESITAEDVKGYKTLVIDTAGRALDALAVDIIRENPKMGRGGGALSLQGFGVLKDRFKSFTNLIRSFGLDIVLLVHGDEQKNGDDIIERLDAQGASKNEIYKQSDLMGRLKIEGGKRLLNFNPSDTAFGKNPAALPVLEVPDFRAHPDSQFLAKVLSDTKEALNRLTEAQTKAAEELAAWRAKFEALDGAKAFNDMIGTVSSEASEAVRANAGRLLVKVARDKGLSFDGKSRQFIVKEGAQPEPQAQPAERKAEATTDAPAEQPTEPQAEKKPARRAKKEEAKSDVTEEQRKAA